MISQSKIEFNFDFDSDPIVFQSIEFDNKVKRSFQMSIEECPDEIVLTIMIKLNSEDIEKLGCCKKRFFSLTQKNHLWIHKLILDFPLLVDFPLLESQKFLYTQPSDFLRHQIKSNLISQLNYLWQYQLESNFKVLDQELNNCEYEMPSDFLKSLHYCIKEAGPRIFFDIQPLLQRLDARSPYRVDILVKKSIQDAILKSFWFFKKAHNSETQKAKLNKATEKVTILQSKIADYNPKLPQLKDDNRQLQKLKDKLKIAKIQCDYLFIDYFYCELMDEYTKIQK